MISDDQLYPVPVLIVSSIVEAGTSDELGWDERETFTSWGDIAGICGQYSCKLLFGETALPNKIQHGRTLKIIEQSGARLA